MQCWHVQVAIYALTFPKWQSWDAIRSSILLRSRCKLNQFTHTHTHTHTHKGNTFCGHQIKLKDRTSEESGALVLAVSRLEDWAKRRILRAPTGKNIFRNSPSTIHTSLWAIIASSPARRSWQPSWGGKGGEEGERGEGEEGEEREGLKSEREREGFISAVASTLNWTKIILIEPNTPCFLSTCPIFCLAKCLQMQSKCRFHRDFQALQLNFFRKLQ